MKGLCPCVVSIDRHLQAVGQTIFEFGSPFDLIKRPADFLVPPRRPLLYFHRALRQQVGRIDETKHQLLGRGSETDKRECDREGQAAQSSVLPYGTSPRPPRFASFSLVQMRRPVIARRPRLPQPRYAPIEFVPIVSVTHCQPLWVRARTRSLAGFRCLSGKGGWLKNCCSRPVTFAGHGTDLVPSENASGPTRLFRQDQFARRCHLQTIVLLLVANNDQPIATQKVTAGKSFW